MASTYNLLKARIQTIADLAGGVLQVALGTTGAAVLLPDEEDPNDPVGQIPHLTGGCWVSSNPLDGALAGIGGLLDDFGAAWGYISTNAAGVAPTLDNAWGLGAPTKDEVLKQLTVVLNPAYLDSCMFCIATVRNAVWVQKLVALNTMSATFEFYDVNGAIQAINDLAVLFLAIGEK